MNFLLGPILGFLSKIAEFMGWALWGSERQRRKAAEADTALMKEKETIREDVRDDSDNDLIDRLSSDK